MSKLKKYKYTAIDTDNNKSTGFLLAENKLEVQQLLLEANLYLVSCKVISESTLLSRSTYRASTIAAFAHELSAMLKVGIPIIDALEALKEEIYIKTLNRTIESLIGDIKSGKCLSEAFAKHDKVFPELFINMTYIGESLGTIDTVMDELADYYEREYKFKQRIANALIYPTLLSILALTVFIVIIAVIVPILKTTLIKFDIDLPAITVFIFNVSEFFCQYWQYILLILLVIILAVFLLLRIERVKYVFDAFKAKAPFICRITEGFVAVQFAKGFGALTSSGIEITKALETMGNAITNRYYKKKYFTAYNEIKEGLSIAKAFKKHNVLPKMLIQALDIGEETGNIDQAVKNTSAYFEAKTEAALTHIVTIIEPSLICIMGVIVALIVLSVFLPIMSMITIGG